jgi:hypothetical protein
MKNLVNRPDLLSTSSSFSSMQRKKYLQEQDEMRTSNQGKKHKKKTLQRK